MLRKRANAALMNRLCVLLILIVYLSVKVEIEGFWSF